MSEFEGSAGTQEVENIQAWARKKVTLGQRPTIQDLRSFRGFGLCLGLCIPFQSHPFPLPSNAFLLLKAQVKHHLLQEAFLDSPVWSLSLFQSGGPVGTWREKLEHWGQRVPVFFRLWGARKGFGQGNEVRRAVWRRCSLCLCVCVMHE